MAPPTFGTAGGCCTSSRYARRAAYDVTYRGFVVSSAPLSTVALPLSSGPLNTEITEDTERHRVFPVLSVFLCVPRVLRGDSKLLRPEHGDAVQAVAGLQ